ncbi:hypothetical protein DVH24_013723 [Malus domestica]|uniref:Uncharacterized protein n=1 Tax=Malus domestica TaxID=3750 RepID=A0A498JE98_MALDO|nr:hypothetical protein DVH24_013723 [Malus domestica]
MLKRKSLPNILRDNEAKMNKQHGMIVLELQNNILRKSLNRANLNRKSLGKNLRRLGLKRKSSRKISRQLRLKRKSFRKLSRKLRLKRNILKTSLCRSRLIRRHLARKWLICRVRLIKTKSVIEQKDAEKEALTEKLRQKEAGKAKLNKSLERFWDKTARAEQNECQKEELEKMVEESN